MEDITIENTLKDKINNNNNRKEDFKKNIAIEENFKKETKGWIPRWVSIEVLAKKIMGQMTSDGITPRQELDGFRIEIPENLQDEVTSGKLDPGRYTRSQLEQMSIIKHYTGQVPGINIDDSAVNIEEDYKRTKEEFENLQEEIQNKDLNETSIKKMN